MSFAIRPSIDDELIFFHRVLITSIIRAPYIDILSHTKDFSAKQAEAGIWSIVEINLAILCNNLMRMKPFLSQYLPSIMTKLGLSSSRMSADKRGRSGGSDGPPGGVRWANVTIGGSERLGDHSYQLHSVGTDGNGKADRGGGDIHVVDEFSVHVERHARNKDATSSTDSILGVAGRPQGVGFAR